MLTFPDAFYDASPGVTVWINNFLTFCPQGYNKGLTVNVNACEIWCNPKLSL